MNYLLALLLIVFTAGRLQAEPIRIATYNTELTRAGPGLLLSDIRKKRDPQVSAIVSVITDLGPDILVLQGIDWDYENQALAALLERLAEKELSYPYVFSRQPNSGLTTGLDMDGDGQVHGPGDAQGYGNFTGKAGVAVVSRFPILSDAAEDFTELLWKDLPRALLPKKADGQPFPSPEALTIQRLSSTVHWMVPIELPNGTRLDILTFQAAPPIFDGPEDQNGKRNHDEIRLWEHILNGEISTGLSEFFILSGGANLDPNKGAGRREAIRNLLAHPRLQDPVPRGPDGSFDTVVWPATGAMRVDYLLPSVNLQVLDTGIYNSAAAPARASAASRHWMVWVDIAIN